MANDRCGCGAAAGAMPTAAYEVPPARDDGLDAALKALASAARRQLLRLVAQRTSPEAGASSDEMCACELAGALGLAPSTISHHMSVLVAAGLVSATKRGLWVYYRLERETLARVAAELTAL